MRREEQTHRSSAQSSLIAPIAAFAAMAIWMGCGNGSASHSIEQPRFEPLGAPTGIESTGAEGVSGDGQTVVGWGGSVLFQGIPSTVALLWKRDGDVHELGVPGRAKRASDDGTIVAGDRLYQVVSRRYPILTRAFVWSAEMGVRSLVPDEGHTIALTVTALSSDGSTVVGQSREPGRIGAYSWTAIRGLESLPRLDRDANHVPMAIVADGSTVFGYLNTCEGALEGESSAIRWSGDGSIAILPSVDGRCSCVTSDVSPDGKFVVGTCYERVGSPDVYSDVPAAVRWGELRGEILSSPWDESYSFATATSADGSVVVGTVDVGGTRSAFVWMAPTGMRLLADLLSEADVTVPEGWILADGIDVSDDGRVVVGTAVLPDGRTNAFRAVIPQV